MFNKISIIALKFGLKSISFYQQHLIKVIISVPIYESSGILGRVFYSPTIFTNSFNGTSLNGSLSKNISKRIIPKL